MISVIVPVYNVEKYIISCLDSILKQKCQDFELIIVDDGSKDNSCKRIKEFLNGKKIRWKLLEKENGGQSSARNLGLKEAKGERIVFLDSDDVIASDFLSALESHLLSGDYDFSFCNYVYVKRQIPPQNVEKGVYCFGKEELLTAFLKRTVRFVVPSMMFRKEFLLENNLWFNENTSFSEDQMFIWNVIFHSNVSIYLDQDLYGYYLRERSIMTGSAYGKIMTGYREYEKFTKQLVESYPEKEDLIRLILPRWELGTLFAAASLINRKEYKKMYDSMNGKTILKRIKGIGENNAYLLALVSAISADLLYYLCRKIDLNG